MQLGDKGMEQRTSSEPSTLTLHLMVFEGRSSDTLSTDSPDAPSPTCRQPGVGLAVATVDLPGRSGGSTEALTDRERGAGKPACAPHRAGGQSEPLWGQGTSPLSLP